MTKFIIVGSPREVLPQQRECQQQQQQQQETLNTGSTIETLYVYNLLLLASLFPCSHFNLISHLSWAM